MNNILNLNKTKIWLEAGYEIFAVDGPQNLKIEAISRKVDKSKSSFYHHFVDLNIFIEYLLELHLLRSRIIAEKERSAKKIEPDLIEILIEHKIDLLFNKQLRVNREINIYEDALKKSNQIVGQPFVMLWVKELNLQMTQIQIEGLFDLALENFYLQINIFNLNEQWLSDYFKNLKRIANSFI